MPYAAGLGRLLPRLPWEDLDTGPAYLDLASSHNGRRGGDGDCTYLVGQESIGKLRGDRAGGPTIDAAEGAGGLTRWAVEEIEAPELGGIEARAQPSPAGDIRAERGVP